MRGTVFHRNLSAKVLLLTIVFVLIGEVTIYVPSIARFRQGFLEERIAAAHLAMLTLSPGLADNLDIDTADALLRHAGVLAITVDDGRAVRILGEMVPPDRVVLLDDSGWGTLIRDAVDTLLHRGERVIRVVGASPQEQGTTVDIILADAPLWAAMIKYSWRIVTLSILLSLLVGSLLFLILQGLIVQPLRQITRELAIFRDRPEDATADVAPMGRLDEIGVVERALAEMRHSLRRALSEKTRLAALGAAMSRISHDLRNILATAVLISDRLERSEDPSVRKVGSRLVETLDRAARLCSETLTYARTGPPAPELQRVNLLALVEQVRAALDATAKAVRWRIEVPADLDLLVDPDQMFRVLLNLARNAAEAMGETGGELRIRAQAGPQRLDLDVADTGPGMPERVRRHLFEPFASSAKPDGNGLGLAICRELMRAHGGEIELLESSARGTIFRLVLPARSTLRAGGPRRPAMLENATRSLLALLLLSTVAGCQGPALAGYEGLQWQTRSFYDARATEKNWTCNQPRMRSITGTQIISETPTHVVMNVRYFWVDESQTPSRGVFPFMSVAPTACNGFAQRTFTFVKMSDGSLQPESMTGPQRDS